MLRDNRELWLAFFAALLITLAYGLVVVWTRGIPGASDLFGHSLGILGFILMLMTETLYTYRKRSRTARWGSMASWLQFHIFTGLVGPYMVLLHTSWKFSGLAGVVLLLTVLIVASGFMGRYIYTAVPRTAQGVELEASEIRAQIEATEMDLQRLGVKGQQAESRQLKQLQRRKRRLERQVGSLVMARRMLSLWHTVHVPIGLALFTSAFIHIGAALYYATLLR